MNCLFCGGDLGLKILSGDPDFCISSHRRKYHDRLRRALTQIEEPEATVPAPMNFLSIPNTGTTPNDVEHRIRLITPVAAPLLSRQPVRPSYDSLRPLASELPEPALEGVAEATASITEFTGSHSPKQYIPVESKNLRLDLTIRLSSIRTDLLRKRQCQRALAAC